MRAVFSFVFLILLSLSHNEAAPLATASRNSNSDSEGGMIIGLILLGFIVTIFCCCATGNLTCKEVGQILA
jgi:hypothetical protein